MSLASLFKLHAITSDSGTIGLLSDLTAAYNFSDLTEFAAGHPAPLFVGAAGSVPGFRFSTRDVGGILGWIDTAGIAKDLSADNCDLTFRQSKSHGTREANATETHIRGRMTSNALLIWDSVRATQGQAAEVTARLIPVWDGVNDCLIFTNDVALSGTISVANTWTLGPVSLNGSAVPGVQEWEWSNNIVLDEEASDGEEFNSWASVASFQPVLRLRTRELDVMADYGPRGTAVSASAPVAYLRARKKGGINELDATEKHVKLTGVVSHGVIKAREIANNMAEVTVEYASADDSADPFTLAVNQAIT